MSLFSPTDNPAAPVATPYQLNVIPTPSQSIASLNSSPLRGGGSTSNSGLFTWNEQAGDETDDSPSHETRARQRSKEDRCRATASKPVYGHVTGVLRGPNKVHGMLHN